MSIQELLDFEAAHPQCNAEKVRLIRAAFECSATIYYQRLNRAIDDPAALAHAPALVDRLRRVRAEQRDQRTARRIITDPRPVETLNPRQGVLS